MLVQELQHRHAVLCKKESAVQRLTAALCRHLTDHGSCCQLHGGNACQEQTSGLQIITVACWTLQAGQNESGDEIRYLVRLWCADILRAFQS